MGENTKIEWCGYTFNPWVGCTRISPGCNNCYAADLARRYGWVKQWGEPGKPGDYRRTSEANWRKPLQWARKATREKAEAWARQEAPPPRPRVFCASLADVWDNQVDPRWRADLLELIHATPELDWLLLTKRPENIEKMLLKAIEGLPLWPWPNVWLGFTAEDQEHFDRRWPIMREIPAAVRFCSYEPAIGPLTLCTGTNLHGLDWLICGGESGRGFRYMDLAWARNIEAECRLNGIAFFMKQLAGKKPFPPEFSVVREFPRSAA